MRGNKQSSPTHSFLQKKLVKAPKMSATDVLKKRDGQDRDAWKKIQEKTFTNWFNDRLRGNLRVAKKQV